jgi:hypothetical protein
MMMHTIDSIQLDAFAQLLARPDPSDLPRRAHVSRYDGDPNRRTTRYPQILMNWLQQRHLENDGDEPIAKATRNWKARADRVRADLRRLRPTGTC